MIKQAGIYAQNPTALVFKGLMLLFLVSFTNIFTGCAEDNEPNETSPSNPDNHVTINADGTATGGAVFSPIDDTTFFLDYVKYEIVDAHLEIIGYDGNEISSEPKLYAEVKINGVTYKTRILRDRSFYNCSKLKSITIPSTVTKLGFSCFSSCANLQSIELSDELAYINDGCFSGCSRLRSVTFKDKIPNIHFWSFTGCSNIIVYVPLPLLEKFQELLQYSEISEVIGY